MHLLAALLDDVALVPLPGHTFGHVGIAVRGGRSWMLLAADAYFFHMEMDRDRPRCTPGLTFYQRMMEQEGAARRRNQARRCGLFAARARN